MRRVSFESADDALVTSAWTMGSGSAYVSRNDCGQVGGIRERFLWAGVWSIMPQRSCGGGSVVLIHVRDVGVHGSRDGSCLRASNLSSMPRRELRISGGGGSGGDVGGGSSSVGTRGDSSGGVGCGNDAKNGGSR
jgi:hypothetical protein